MKLHKSPLIMTVSLVISWFFLVFYGLRLYDKPNTNAFFFDFDHGLRPARQPFILWIGHAASAVRSCRLEALMIRTVLCGHLQKRHKHKTFRCSTALTTIYKRHDSDGRLNLMH